jgi:hypothetical protein
MAQKLEAKFEDLDRRLMNLEEQVTALKSSTWSKILGTNSKPPATSQPPVQASPAQVPSSTTVNATQVEKLSLAVTDEPAQSEGEPQVPDLAEKERKPSEEESSSWWWPWADSPRR